METSILALAVGVVLGCPVASYAAENSNVIEGLFLGLDHSHRGYQVADSPSSDPFTPRRTDGLSSNVDACASYGCVGGGGG